jgi:hypothetical protein
VLRGQAMTEASARSSRDWLANPRANILAWWIPHGAIVAALFLPPYVRAVAWTVALMWMGIACILNARRCNRTHCRFTGPYYLAMIAPVLALGTGVVSASMYGWIALGILIVAGDKLIWWATECAWGKFS